jgi:adenosylcobinamide-GDP ribazoletransferase
MSDIVGTTSADEPPRTSDWLSFITAVQFLTRVPLSTAPASAEALRRSPVYFPLVGGLIGLTTTAAFWLGTGVWPAWLAVIAALAFEAWLTGALHEDAVADFCDAFGGGWTRERTLEILRDSRIGTYGVLGVTFAVALRGAATLALFATDVHVLTWGSAVIAAAAMGRWMMVVAMWAVAPVPNREGLAQDVGRRVTTRDLIVSSVWAVPCVAVFVALHPLHALLAAVLLALFSWNFLVFIQKRVGGTTGDCLGCLGYLSQVLVLLVASARFTIGGLS